MKLTDTAETVLSRRYYLEGEDWEALCRRVAKCVAGAELSAEKADKFEELFFQMIHSLDFLPNSPCLMNAGTELGQLSACFVLPIEDTLAGIFEAVKNGALVNKTGGGTGYSFSRLRAKDSCVCSTNGVASGPVSFAGVFNEATEVIKQGGRRRGANMGVLRCDHPDVMEFIQVKKDHTKLTNFNLSVALTDAFVEAVKNDEFYQLVDPVTKKNVRPMRARKVFNEIIDCAWENGEPGVLFIDAANRANPTPHLGAFEATNPCWTGDTKVWTSEGPVSFYELAKSGNDVLVLTQDDTGTLMYKTMRNPRKTATCAELVRVTFDNGTSVDCTPNHNIYLRSGDKVQAKDLRRGDSIASLYRYKANSKGYLRVTNGIEAPLEHHLNVSIPFGRRPIYPQEHCHHLNGVVDANHWTNLSIVPSSEHNSWHTIGEKNPMFGVWDERNPLFGIDVAGENNPRFRHDICDDVVLSMRSSGMSIDGIAKELACSPYTVSKRLGWVRGEEKVNHRVVSVVAVGNKKDVFNGTVDDTHRYFVMCGENDAILSANCGEQWLLPFEACNLGSINLANFVKIVSLDGTMAIHWEKLKERVRLATRFLDNVVDANVFPIPEIKAATQETRKIGLGIMGLHDMLIMLDVPYGSEEGRKIAGEVMNFIKEEAHNASLRLSAEKGLCPGLFHHATGQDLFAAQSIPRNAALTSIQPTGTVSMIADCSSGCEPYFAVVNKKNVMDGESFLMVNKLFEEVAKREGFYSEEIMEEVSKTGSVVGVNGIPEHFQKVFSCAQDISVEDHILMQAALQANGVDASISKTINMPSNATKEDVKSAYLKAWGLGCKGLTVYRDGCREGQVLTSGDGNDKTPDFVDGGPVPTHSVKMLLPDELRARRYRLKDSTGESIYIIICFADDKTPVEVFAKFPSDNRIEQQERATMWATTCRMVSLALRCNIPIDEVIKQLDRSSGSMFDLPAQLSKLLKSFISSTGRAISGELCPDCKIGTLVYEEGCSVCKSCGYSKCS